MWKSQFTVNGYKLTWQDARVQAAGVPVKVNGLRIEMEGFGPKGPALKARAWIVPGDFSSAAYAMVAVAARGSATVTLDEIEAGRRSSVGRKVKTLAAIARIVRTAQAHGARVVFTNGCFDLLHVGHVRYLREARPPFSPDAVVAEFGAERVTVAIDAAQNPKMASGYEVFIDGGRTATGADAVEWAKKVDGVGVKTILPTSKSTDGVRTGYDLPLIRAIKESTAADVVASGGAGTLPHFLEAVQAGATVLLAASVFHYCTFSIRQVKEYLRGRGLTVKL
jgi:hypothetical protein